MCSRSNALDDVIANEPLSTIYSTCLSLAMKSLTAFGALSNLQCGKCAFRCVILDKKSLREHFVPGTCRPRGLVIRRFKHSASHPQAVRASRVPGSPSNVGHFNLMSSFPPSSSWRKTCLPHLNPILAVYTDRSRTVILFRHSKPALFLDAAVLSLIGAGWGACTEQ